MGWESEEPLIPADTDRTRSELLPHRIVDFGDVRQREPRAQRTLAGEAHLDPTHARLRYPLGLIDPRGVEPVGRVACFDHASGVALELVATAEPEVAGDREEPQRDPLGSCDRV